MILCGRGCHNLFVSSSRLETPNANAICYENGFSLCEASVKAKYASSYLRHCTEFQYTKYTPSHKNYYKYHLQ
jgi:hypothetical protein